LFSLLYAIKDEWLSSIISVCSHSEQYLVGSAVGLESIIKTKDWVCWSLINMAPDAEAPGSCLGNALVEASPLNEF